MKTATAKIENAPQTMAAAIAKVEDQFRAIMPAKWVEDFRQEVREYTRFAGLPMPIKPHMYEAYGKLLDVAADSDAVISYLEYEIALFKRLNAAQKAEVSAPYKNSRHCRFNTDNAKLFLLLIAMAGERRLAGKCYEIELREMVQLFGEEVDERIRIERAKR